MKPSNGPTGGSSEGKRAPSRGLKGNNPAVPTRSRQRPTTGKAKRQPRPSATPDTGHRRTKSPVKESSRPSNADGRPARVPSGGSRGRKGSNVASPFKSTPDRISTSPKNNVNGNSLFYEEDDTIETSAELVPLTGVSSSVAAAPNHQKAGSRKSPLEIEIPYQQYANVRQRRRQPGKQPHVSYIPNDPWYKVMASIVFLCVLVTPILAIIAMVGRGTRYDRQRPNDVVRLPTCDQAEYQQTFDELLQQVAEMKDEERCEVALQEAFDLKTCRCLDPLVGEAYSNGATMFQKEKKDVTEAVSNLIYGIIVDVALLGDSITYRWNGVPELYKKYFSKQDGASLDGVNLGVPGERTRNVLYRLRNEALGNDGNFRPKVFWLLVGTNDLSLDQCAVENVVAGIIAIVEDLRQRRPEATIVVNGIIPRSGPLGTLLNTYASFVNDRLECYASMREGVEYFDASSSFQNDDGVIDGLEKDGVHPNALGYDRWGQAIVEKVSELITNEGN